MSPFVAFAANPAAPKAPTTRPSKAATSQPAKKTVKPAPKIQPAPKPKSPAVPKPKPPVKPTPKPKKTKPPKTVMVTTVTIKNAARPESFLYMLLRLSPKGNDKFKKQIKHYRMLSHEQKRKVGGKWFAPADFTRRRTTFLCHMKAAKEKFREAKRLEKKEDGGSKRKRKALLATGNRTLAKASQSWADPLLRKYLMGLTKLREGNNAAAESYFRECATQLPQIAAFHQARAMALRNLKRDEDALKENIAVLNLMPNSRDAFGMLLLAMKNVSGPTSQGKIYKDARAMVKQYIKPAPYTPRKNSTTWLFPGVKLRSDSELLPVLPFDRIELCQGVGVPVTENALAVDLSVVVGAKEVFLRAGSQIFPGRVDRQSLKPGALVALVYFYECKFTPLKLLPSDQFKPKLEGIARTMNIFREMGNKVRCFPVMVTKVDGQNVTLSIGTAPGEGGGPVVDVKNRLMGFLGGKIDPQEGKFPEKFYSAMQLREAIEKITKRKSKPPWRGKRNVTPKAVSGKSFLIEAIHYETLSEKAK
ncbi:MAG: hypothetical protein KAR11_06445 [Phycisphaerae bacterium]|nr:hypothetical protein [Phycisphaerae bacterium]